LRKSESQENLNQEPKTLIAADLKLNASAMLQYCYQVGAAA